MLPTRDFRDFLHLRSRKALYDGKGHLAGEEDGSLGFVADLDFNVIFMSLSRPFVRHIARSYATRQPARNRLGPTLSLDHVCRDPI